MQLPDVIARAQGFGSLTYLASVTPANHPHVTPVIVAWEREQAWVMVSVTSQKASNLRQNPNGLLHFPTSEQLESLMIWCSATLDDDVATKRRLWAGVFDYDLNAFAPGGPEESPGTAFVRLVPQRALLMSDAGLREQWRR
ncbi:MAG: pyridoxamine 5'-phosphate oxidase family protein [Acidimicrobiia bacterium]|nr:pyridoxamine 5'-phosphate oxidase family protein [Acidimicrobiia bacterium]